MKEIHKSIIYIVIIMILGLGLGILFGYITSIASSALGIVRFEEKE
ncbi:MAG: hypothetical protein HWN67_21920 [Candidatus Helarchaeota archaeon]|nr:hypothetical protein [Candidatus Helarchaeota archaeon]